MYRHLAVLLILASSLWAWDKNGSPIATGPGDQAKVKLAPVDSSGFYAAWEDYNRPRSARVRLFDRNGHPQWQGVMPACITESGTWLQAIVCTPAGDAIAAFEVFHGGGSRAYVSKLGRSAYYVWGPRAVKASAADSYQKYPRLCLDETGEGCIVAWEDWRSGASDAWIAHVTSSGQVDWERRLTGQASRDGHEPKVVPSGDGALALWTKWVPGDTIHTLYAQRVTASGTLMFADPGVLVDHISYFSIEGDNFHVTSDDRGGAFVLFWRPGQPGGLWVQRVDSAGRVCYPPGGILVVDYSGFASPRLWSQIYPDDGFCSDLHGGCLVSAQTNNPYAFNGTLWVNRVDSAGSLPWGTTGVKAWEGNLGPMMSFDPYSSIVPDGVGGGIVGWSTENDSSTGEIMTARIDPGGTVRWYASLCEGDSVHAYPVPMDAGGGAVACWEDERNGTIDLYGRMVDTLGQLGVDEGRDHGAGCHQSAPEVTVRQNPAGGTVALDYWLSLGQPGTLHVLDVTGRAVQTVALPAQPVSTAHGLRLTVHAPPGVYFIRLVSAGQSATAKVVKME